MPKFQVYKDAVGKFRFRLRAGNNQIVAVGEAYVQHASCLNGIRSIQKNCGAEIEDLTIKGHKVPNPKYQIYKDVKGEFRFRLKAANGEIIAEGEGYESKEGCLNGINVVKSSCDAEIEDLTVPKKSNEENVVPAKMEETTSVPETVFEGLSASEKANVVETSTPKIEGAEVSSGVLPPPEKEAILPPQKTEDALPPPKTGELPQTAPISTAEMEVPPRSGPIETTLELFAIQNNIAKGNNVSFQGMLSETNSGKGIAGAEIRIYKTKSIFGDDWLAFGRTNQNGAFNISWKARSITWRKNAANIYAKFLGNETAKPTKSVIQPVKVN